MHWPPYLSDIKPYTPDQSNLKDDAALSLYRSTYESFCSNTGARKTFVSIPILIPSEEPLSYLLNNIDRQVIERFSKCAVTALLYIVLSKNNKEDLHNCFSAVCYLLACNGIKVDFCSDFRNELLLVKKYKYDKSAELLDIFDEAVGADIIINIEDKPSAAEYPERLLKDLEKCGSIASMLDTVFRYQMLSPEIVRKEDAKEAFLTGYKYSLDIST